jgi:hypothetical protein
VSLNALLTSALVSASRPAEGALTSTPINRAPCAFANATARRIRSTVSTVDRDREDVLVRHLRPSRAAAARVSFNSRRVLVDDCSQTEALGCEQALGRSAGNPSASTEAASKQQDHPARAAFGARST